MTSVCETDNMYEFTVCMCVLQKNKTRRDAKTCEWPGGGLGRVGVQLGGRRHLVPVSEAALLSGQNTHMQHSETLAHTLRYTYPPHIDTLSRRMSA